jgi:hypothetical protein
LDAAGLVGAGGDAPLHDAVRGARSGTLDPALALARVVLPSLDLPLAALHARYSARLRAAGADGDVLRMLEALEAARLTLHSRPAVLVARGALPLFHITNTGGNPLVPALVVDLDRYNCELALRLGRTLTAATAILAVVGPLIAIWAGLLDRVFPP